MWCARMYSVNNMEESRECSENVNPRRPSKCMRLMPAEERRSNVPQGIKKFIAHYRIVRIQNVRLMTLKNCVQFDGEFFVNRSNPDFFARVSAV